MLLGFCPGVECQEDETEQSNHLVPRLRASGRVALFPYTPS